MPARNHHTRRYVLNAAAFILMEVAALALVFHNGQIQRSWIGQGINSVNAVFWGSVENAERYFHLREENAVLAAEILVQQQMLGQRQPQVVPDDTLGCWIYRTAQIVKHQFKGTHSYFLLDKGEDDGVENGCGVITPRGVIGVVDAVSAHYSYVRSFFSAGMTVSVREDSTGVTGPLVWAGNNRNSAILHNIPHHITIPAGRVLKTSSFSGIYPPDIPVGVTGESRVSTDGTREIAVNLYENPSQLRYVIIVSNAWREEIEALEQ